MTLHRHDDCPGSFQRDGRNWRCSTCRAVAYGCDSVDAEVRRELQHALVLRHLTAEGETPRG